MSRTPEGGQGLGYVHRFVPSSGSPVTLLLLHGTGGDEGDLLPLGGRLLPGAALLSPRGNVLENGMPRFFRRLSEGVFDMNDLVKRTDELDSFVRRASQVYGFDLNRVVAVGYSNGANIAASTLLLHPGLLAGAVLLRPMVPVRLQGVPDLSRVKILILAGTRDAVVGRELPEELAGLLRKGGAEVALQWEDAGHQLTDHEMDAATTWLSQRFG